jgi:uncharacterized protein (TIGR02145 family)
MPGFGANLGTITLGEEIKLGGKIWSGPVTASNCQKETFNGGRMVARERNLSLNADCRTNPRFEGSLFSWCAVVRFADELCPYPWRVPTEKDFEELMIAVCGYFVAFSGIPFTHPVRGGVPEHLIRTRDQTNSCFTLLTKWGGNNANRCDSDGTIILPVDITHPMVNPNILNQLPPSWHYWSQSEQDVKEAWRFESGLGGHNVALRMTDKNTGVALRCVKDK